MSSILNIVGGGFAGSSLTYGLTWLRERKRIADAYRAPQREAVAAIVTAIYELLLAFQGEYGPYWRLEDRKVSEETAHPQLGNSGDQIQRAFHGIDTAINVGQITIVDAKCCEAVDRLSKTLSYYRLRLNNFVELNEPRADNSSSIIAESRACALLFDLDITALVNAAYHQLSPVQTWRNRRKLKPKKWV